MQAITRAATRQELPALLEFVERACARCNAGEADAFAVRLIVEEACMNVIEHGYRGVAAGPITLRCRCTRGALIVTICDRAEPFDPGDAPMPDLTSEWGKRRVGGLGWHLIRHLTHRIRYRADAERGNRLTLVRRFSTSLAPARRR